MKGLLIFLISAALGGILWVGCSTSRKADKAAQEGAAAAEQTIPQERPAGRQPGAVDPEHGPWEKMRRREPFGQIAGSAGSAPAGSVGHATMGSAAHLPNGVAFRMSGDYADHVGVQIDAAGQLVSYPAPTDILPDAAAMSLGDGWWLSRQGVTSNTVFTRWTFEEYRNMKSAPTPAEILAAVIPGAKVTMVQTLPMNQTEAFADTAAVCAYLRKFAISLPVR